VAERLSAADRAALTAEQGAINMAVGGVLVLDGGPGLRHERILSQIDSRLHLVPKYRKRLAHLTPGGLTNPVWADDRGFDLGWHVRRAALSAPGSDAQLAEFVGHEMSRRLDRSRPLWEISVVEGMSHGRVALVFKMHHALVDGVAAVDVGMLLFDPTTEPLQIPPPDAPWEPRPYDRSRHLRDLALGRALETGRMVAGKAHRALRPELSLRGLSPVPLRALPEVVKATELLAELARQRPQAPMSPLNRPIGPNRRYALHRVRLEDIKRTGTDAGGTVNDTVLAAVTGMLRRYFDVAGVYLGARPVALVPVSVRKPGEEGGNRISMVFIDLPIDEPDPRQRIRIINAEMSKLKESAAVRAGAMIAGATGFAPPLMSAFLARAFSGVRAMNLVVSNVPGPQQPFYLNGQRLRTVFPVVPLNPGNQGLSVGVMSYDGGVAFGLLADRDLDPPLSVAADALRDAIDELLGHVPGDGRARWY
jgi:WS/DGAT/MGAT family acyltransferase